MRIGLPLCLAALLTTCLAQAPAPTVNVHQIASALDHHYDSLRSLKEDFQESYQGEGTRREEMGALWLRRPGKMRWEYTEPQKKLFLIDGKNVYFYVAGDKQATRSSLKDTDDLRTPLRYLLGKTKLEKELRELRIVSTTDRGEVVLTGVPKSMEDRVQSVELELNAQHQIVRLRIDSTDGSTTEFQFSNIVENPPAADDLFRFMPPPGVDVIQDNGAQP